MSIDTIIRSKGNGVVTSTPDATIADVTRLMADYRIGLVVVCNAAGTVAGVLSERDVVRAVADYGARVAELRVADVCTGNPIVCTPQHHARDVLKVMNERGFRHMPVVEHGMLRGLVSIKDVLKYMLEETAMKEQSQVWSELQFI